MQTIETEIVEQINNSLQRGLSYSTEQIIDYANKCLLNRDDTQHSPATLATIWWELGLRLGVADSVVNYFWSRSKLRFSDISVLKLSARIERTLRSHGIITVDQLAQFSDRELLTLPGFGEKSLRDIKAILKHCAL